jgi:3-hydroxybutyrate dehydrogenase
MEFTDKTVFITGGSRGIGRACALAFGREGARVAVAARTIDQLEAVASEVRELGSSAMAIPLDMKRNETIEAAFKQVAENFGPVDILINNAGIAHSVPFIKCTEELWNDIMEINLTGTFRCTKAALPPMLKRGWGRIINIASVAGKAGGPYISAYVASKHGVVGLTKALAQEFATKGITVNAICPGYVDTDMAEFAIKTIGEKSGYSPEQARAYLESTTPQKRLFQPEEVAALALMLGRQLAGGINGQAINICGGALPF